MDDVISEKRALRDRVRSSRRERGAAGCADLAPAFTEQQIALTRELAAHSVATYLSMPDEPDTRGFAAWTLERGLQLLLPIVRNDGLLDWAEYSGTETVGAFGLPEPEGDVRPPSALQSVDLILVPAAAVDRKGNRLGWGRGFFDKALSAMEQFPPVYAVVNDDEVVDVVPHEPHDRPVDGAITPSGRLTFSRI